MVVVVSELLHLVVNREVVEGLPREVVGTGGMEVVEGSKEVEARVAVEVEVGMVDIGAVLAVVLVDIVEVVDTGVVEEVVADTVEVEDIGAVVEVVL